MDLRVDRAKEMMGARLRRLREENGVSVSELARLADIDRSYIHDIEAGRGNPTIEVYARLLSFCGLDFEEFLAGFRAESIPARQHEAYRMLGVILNSGVNELVQGIHVTLEAMAEKASRMHRARAAPSPPNRAGEDRVAGRLKRRSKTHN